MNFLSYIPARNTTGKLSNGFLHVTAKPGGDVYPYGSLKPGRYYNPDDYSFSFNGMEKDDEIKGTGNSLNFGARFQDSRLGRFKSVDPLASKYPYQSPYTFVANNPIFFVDPDGREVIAHWTKNKNGKPVLKVTMTATLVNVSGNSLGNGNDITQRIEDILEDAMNGSAGKYDIEFDLKLKYKESLAEVPLDDNVIIVSNFSPHSAANSNPGTASDYVNGVTAIRGGRVSWVDNDIFRGLIDDLVENGEYTASHEFLHQLGLPDEGYQDGLATEGRGFLLGVGNTNISEKTRNKFGQNIMNGAGNIGSWYNIGDLKYFGKIAPSRSSNAARAGAHISQGTTNASTKQKMQVRHKVTTTTSRGTTTKVLK